MKQCATIIFTTIAFLIMAINSIRAAEPDSVLNYHRSSIYSLMLNPGEKYAEQIETVFYTLPENEKFNNHDLALKSIPDNEKSNDKSAKITDMLNQMGVAKRMVGLWFNRAPQAGFFDMELVATRGHYDASVLDLQRALSSSRGVAMIADAGEQLIGNTYVLVNDIRYVDKEKGAQVAAAIFSIIGSAASVASSVNSSTGGSSSTTDIANIAKSGAKLGQVISESIVGFTVTINSYLYKLEWNDEIANTFYEKHYFDSTNIDTLKRDLFESDSTTYCLTYIGKHKVTSDKTSIRGLSTNEELICKTLRRALDKSLVELQRQNEIFRIKVPLISTEPLRAYIGLKEGVSKKSVFEVLEKRIDSRGRLNYVRVATIAPENNKIWDNRFMAAQEEANGADFGATTFRKLSGSDIYSGMLIREIKF